MFYAFFGGFYPGEGFFYCIKISRNIDPPYNTGNDFVYNDDFAENAEDYLANSGQYDGEGNRLVQNTESNGRFHTDWLNMIYPRLKMARNLLAEDGVIFISINDVEMDNLSHICSEIFGKMNCVATLIWQQRKGGGNDSKYIAVDHEYILIYSKNIQMLEKKWRIAQSEEYLTRYKERDIDGKKYYWDTLVRNGLQSPIVITLQTPDGSNITINSQWSKAKVEAGLKDGTVRFTKTSTGWSLHHKVYQPDGQVLRSQLTEYGNNRSAGQELMSLFGNLYFDYAKPVTLITLLQTLCTKTDDLDVEMETGTGKTYVYIKTMFELNKQYGWSKFIVVVPSIAIREGVYKSFEYTAEHFMQHYKKKARFFIYNSSNLNQLDTFSSSAGINVMIINTQAFAASMNEDKNVEGRKGDAAARIIYSKRDEFGSRRPIDVIAANNPIIILDEPQKMGGEVTQKALKNFNPLFTINYSATHKEQHNLVYVLDALEAYNQRLVKRIEVKGFEVKNLRGTDHYMFLEEIVLSKNKPPMAKIEMEIGYHKSTNRETRILGVGDRLYAASKEMEQYKGYVISEIDPLRATVTFTNGVTIYRGDVVGDVSEKDMRRIQIRETIISHFEKEEKLFSRGIKTLSLFFIDEVSKYRQYDEDGNEVLGEYGKMFEQEYIDVANNYIKIFDTPYQRYLKSTWDDVSKVHRGYFSIDKKTGRSINSTAKKGSEFSDDISAYDLILKNKERLLSFQEPTRFIFSHSALREGWDNPNIFQICTLKHSDSNIAKRQEVGRGLRLCVNQDGNRMDATTCGASVHDLNVLTVVASESYKDFVSALQSDIKENLYDRPKTATADFFKGKLILVDDQPVEIDQKTAKKIEFYLIQSGYVDMDMKITPKYRNDLANGTVAPLPQEMAPMAEGIHKLIQAVYDESILKDMIRNGNETKVKENPLNENFKKKEFQELWNLINHKYAYTCSFKSEELIAKSIAAIDEKLFVTELQYTTSVGSQKAEMNQYEVERGDSFQTAKTKTQTLTHRESSSVPYDLIGKIADGTKLTRRTVAAILKGISQVRLNMFKRNPEEFISKTILMINEQKATMVIDHITYDMTSGTYDNDIFTAEKSSQSIDKAFKATKAIQDYVFTDGSAVDSVEMKFATALDAAAEVCVYAKLPRGFAIPTPVGNYSPDWAIAFNEGTVKHIFFVAETKGSMDTMTFNHISSLEKAKIDCAKVLFRQLNNGAVKYDVVDSYQSLLNLMIGQ